MTKFVRPDGRPDDKAWLYDQVLSFVTQMTNHERAYLGKIGPRSEREVYSKFAPLSGHPFVAERPSWDRKNRKVKRDMVRATIRRLIADGKIRVERQIARNPKSMHGLEVSQRKSDLHLFGKEHDGMIRTYVETNVLQAMADALGEA